MGYQREALTPEFERDILIPEAMTLIVARRATVSASIISAATRMSAIEHADPAQHHLAMEVQHFESEIANRYEIEVRTLEHKKGHKPKAQLPAPIRPVNTARTVTQALTPPAEIGGGGYFPSAPKPIRMPSRPDDFPSALWPTAVMILSKLIERFPNQNHLRELCEHAVSEITPLYSEAVETGKMKPGALLNDRSGMEVIGSWARLNCENMAVIPAWLMRSNLDDPRRIPYLLVWKDQRDGRIMEAVRLACFIACGREGNGYVELKRTDGSTTILRIVWRMLPHKGGRAHLLLCPHCDRPRRHVDAAGNGIAFRDGRTE